MLGSRQSVMPCPPKGMPVQTWYDKLYNQWYERESWCQVYEHPLGTTLPVRRHYNEFNRSQIKFERPIKDTKWTVCDRSRGVIFPPSRRCFPGKNASQLHNCL